MILIGHPQQSIAGLIAHRLSSCPEKVMIVTDGLSLVEMVTEHSVSLLVLDISICGQNLEIVQSIRAMHAQKKVGIILFGVNVSCEARQRAAEVGADMCLARKEVNSGRLIEIIKDFLPAAVAGRQFACPISPERGYQLEGPFKWAPRVDLAKGQRVAAPIGPGPLALVFRRALAKWKAIAAMVKRFGRVPPVLHPVDPRSRVQSAAR